MTWMTSGRRRAVPSAGPERGEQARRILAGLPDEERLAITMALYKGLSCRQVACALQQPEPVVKSWIRSGLRRMRSELDGAAVSAGLVSSATRDATGREPTLHLV